MTHPNRLDNGLYACLLSALLVLTLVMATGPTHNAPVTPPAESGTRA